MIMKNGTISLDKSRGENMAKILRPTYIYESVDKIPFEILEKNKIKGLIFDLDNTLTDYKGIISKEKADWIREAKARNIRMCILSNSHRQKKIRGFMKELDINGLNFAMKPLQRGYGFALDLLDLPKDQVCMIGDQVFTDIWGANIFGIISILVRPFDKNEEFWVKIKRPIENIILKDHKQYKADIKMKKGKK